MVDSKLISQKDTTVEVIDFRKDHIRDLFSNSLPDQALQKLITEKSGDNLLGLSRFEVVFNYDDRYGIIYSNSVEELLEYNPNYTSFTGTISIDSSNNTSFENSFKRKKSIFLQNYSSSNTHWIS